MAAVNRYQIEGGSPNGIRTRTTIIACNGRYQQAPEFGKTVHLKMRGRDPSVVSATPIYRTWVVLNIPDTSGAQSGYAGLVDIAVADQW